MQLGLVGFGAQGFGPCDLLRDRFGAVRAVEQAPAIET